MIKLQIDDRTVEMANGTNLLKACLSKRIYIPNLCYLNGMEHPPASCRLCFVEIEGIDHPVSACTISVDREMAVRTDTPQVRQLQKTALQLLISVHDVDCKNCPANRRCVLQDMARFLKTAITSGHLDEFLKKTRIDQRHPRLEYYPNRCVLCGKCIYICHKRNNRAELTFAKRGFNTVISFFDIPDETPSSCETCRACVDICPVAALILKTGSTSISHHNTFPTRIGTADKGSIFD